MKIRNGFVSNSSSSSCVIYNLDKAKLESLIDEYIATINFDDYDYLETDADLVKQCILNKLHNTPIKEVKESIMIYVKGELEEVFYYMISYFQNLRQWELSGCKNCLSYKKNFKEKIGDCSNCWNHYYWQSAEKARRDLEYHCANFPEFNFKNEFKEIKDLVYKLPIIERGKGKEKERVIDNDALSKYDIEDTYANLYFAKWLEKHPNAYVLSFASDDGDDSEALVRYDIMNFVLFMQEHGIAGFKGENS